MVFGRDANAVAVIDAGIGNTSSLTSAFQKSGVNVVTLAEPSRLQTFQRVVLPGVGNFAAFGNALRQSGFWSGILELTQRTGTSLLGICVGAQILQNRSEESPDATGLGLLDGSVRKLQSHESTYIPRVGWDTLNYRSVGMRSVATQERPQRSPRYFFSHSFCMEPSDDSTILAVCASSGTIPAIVRSQNLLGVQFHPERSGNFGQKFLQRFASGAFDAS